MPHVIYAPAGEKDLPRLREIFLQCFGEEAAPEMEYVFSRCGDALWKAERDGIPAAMLVAMPVTIAGGRVESAVFLRGSHPPRLPKTGSVRRAAGSLLPVDGRAGGSRRTAAAG